MLLGHAAGFGLLTAMPLHGVPAARAAVAADHAAVEAELADAVRFVRDHQATPAEAIAEGGFLLIDASMVAQVLARRTTADGLLRRGKQEILTEDEQQELIAAYYKKGNR